MVTSRDPLHITPGVKIRLRRKNRLMRAGRVEEASALAIWIGKDIACHSGKRLVKAKGRMAAKDVWTAVCQLTGRSNDVGSIDGVSAESLNAHYASISTDPSYSVPLAKSTVTSIQKQQYLSEWQVLQILDHLHLKATGMDKYQPTFWELVLQSSVRHLLNDPSTPLQPFPSHLSSPDPVKDSIYSSSARSYRAHIALRLQTISITTVLTRILELTVTSCFLYPSFNYASPTLSLDDHYAFRPIGSTIAALIQLLNTITSVLITDKFLLILCLYYSEALDTVRHLSLTEKVAQFDPPDDVYNWLAEYFYGHFRCAQYQGDLSPFRKSQYQGDLSSLL